MEVSSTQICEDLIALLKLIKANMAKLAEAHNLTPVQLYALYAILHGDTTMGRVASTLHCDASNATGIIDRLVAQKLVTRHENENDRRVKTLQLTDKGRQVINSITKNLPQQLGCTNLNAGERLALHGAIAKLS